jgi:hypothetical protein
MLEQIMALRRSEPRTSNNAGDVVTRPTRTGEVNSRMHWRITNNKQTVARPHGSGLNPDMILLHHENGTRTS